MRRPVLLLVTLALAVLGLPAASGAVPAVTRTRPVAADLSRRRQASRSRSTPPTGRFAAT